MLLKTRFQSNAEQKEILPMEQNGLPYVCLVTEADSFIEGDFPWHWHAAMEIDHITEGEAEFWTTESRVYLKKGDAIFINSNVLHSYHTDKPDSFKLYAHIFDPCFLAGQLQNAIEIKYLKPIMQCAGLEHYLIRPDYDGGVRMISHLIRMIELMRDEPFGYEFEIRTELSRLWCLFFEETAGIRAKDKPKRNPDMERIRKMISYTTPSPAPSMTCCWNRDRTRPGGLPPGRRTPTPG